MKVKLYKLKGLNELRTVRYHPRRHMGKTSGTKVMHWWVNVMLVNELS